MSERTRAPTRTIDVLADRSLGKVDVYPVGFYADLRRAWRGARLGDWTYAKRLLRSVRRYGRRRSYWNGYLAEPYRFPPGVGKCGRGLTKVMALRSLAKQIKRVPVTGQETTDE